MSRQASVGDLRSLLERSLGGEAEATRTFEAAIEVFAQAMTRAADSVCMATGTSLMGRADAEYGQFLVGFRAFDPTPAIEKMFDGIDPEGGFYD